MGVAGGGCYHTDIVIIHIHIRTFVVPRVALSRSLRRSRLFCAFWSLARSFFWLSRVMCRRSRPPTECHARATRFGLCDSREGSGALFLELSVIFAAVEKRGGCGLLTSCHHHFRIRGSIVVSISACHAEDPGSIPGRGVLIAVGDSLLRRRPVTL